jgi:hypothetical protein
MRGAYGTTCRASLVAVGLLCMSKGTVIGDGCLRSASDPKLDILSVGAESPGTSVNALCCPGLFGLSYRRFGHVCRQGH